MDHKTNIHELKEKIREFCEKRDWDQFHNAKELALALSIEASELLEHFRWKTHEETDNLFDDSLKREQIEDEVADITYFLLRMAQMYNIDLTKSLIRKMEKNDKKYPVEKAKGSHKKYTEL